VICSKVRPADRLRCANWECPLMAEMSVLVRGGYGAPVALCGCHARLAYMAGQREGEIWSTDYGLDCEGRVCLADVRQVSWARELLRITGEVPE
jgi:hypothetical protein